MSAGAAARRRRGRPARTAGPEGPATRDRILAAARTEFADRGYDKASIRGIAKAADVDPALVHHYFGTKEQVFAAAIETAFAPVLHVPDVIVAGPPDALGERMTRFFFGLWENPTVRESLLAVFRSALDNADAAEVFQELVARKMMSRVAAELRVPEPKLRAELAASQLVGIALLRYVVRLEPMASADVSDVIALAAPAVQLHLGGAAPSGVPPRGPRAAPEGSG